MTSAPDETRAWRRALRQLRRRQWTVAALLAGSGTAVLLAGGAAPGLAGGLLLAALGGAGGLWLRAASHHAEREFERQGQLHEDLRTACEQRAKAAADRQATEMADLERVTEAIADMNEKLARSNAELDEFAYVASHDLREPLRGMQNYATFLIEDYGHVLDEEGRGRLETLARLSKHLDHLLESLLHYSRVGRSEFAMGEVPLQDVVVDAMDSLRISIEESGLEVRVAGDLPKVYCDRVRVAEIFQNLLTNAIKYNDKPERWVEIGWYPAGSADPKPDSPVFTVRDNGIGIAEKHRATVFRIFKRLHSRERYGGGSGAGLTIAKKIVERHGGRMWLESVPGEGTTFHFTLGGSE